VGNGDQGQAGLGRSEHARLRSQHGRPIAEVVNDIQRAGQRDVFVQAEDGRFVVRGSKGREHIIEAHGEHVTSVRRPDAAHLARVKDGTIRPGTEEEFKKLKALVQ
jgi:filamentous hemagglutinin